MNVSRKCSILRAKAQSTESGHCTRFSLASLLSVSVWMQCVCVRFRLGPKRLLCCFRIFSGFAVKRTFLCVFTRLLACELSTLRQRNGVDYYCFANFFFNFLFLGKSKKWKKKNWTWCENARFGSNKLLKISYNLVPFEKIKIVFIL